MKKKSFIALSALLLVACSSDNEPQIANNMEQVEIKLTAGVESVNNSTRAGGIIDKGYSEELSLSFARIDMDADGHYPTGGYKSASVIKATLNGGNTTFKDDSDNSISQYYLARTAHNTSRMVCWYPQIALDATTATATFDISDGDTDVMLSEDMSGSRSANFSSFTLKHLLTQLKIKAYSPSADVSALWGTIKSIQVVGSPTEYIVTFPIDATSTTYTFAEGATVQNISLKGYTNPVSVPIGSASALDCGHIMIPPATKIITLKITTEKGGVLGETEVTIPSFNYLKSNAYQITLKFNGSDISPTVSIGEWSTPIDNGEINVQ